MKRKRESHEDRGFTKRSRTQDANAPSSIQVLLQQYYPTICSLRQYLATQLQGVSEKQRRRVQIYGTSSDVHTRYSANAETVKLLDEIVVGVLDNPDHISYEPTEHDIIVFTQQLSANSGSTSSGHRALTQSEIVDLAIWLLERKFFALQKTHLLTNDAHQSFVLQENGARPEFRRESCHVRNRYARILSQQPWTALPTLIGKGAERIIGDLLLKCGIFRSDGCNDNYQQLCGTPLSELKPLSLGPKTSKELRNSGSKSTLTEKLDCRSLGDIRFVRFRMFYARPTTGANNNVHFSLGRKHVLNRLQDINSQDETIHTMQYIFPRQFGHHNVFTSEVDCKETSQPLKDYTVREVEIRQWKLNWTQNHRQADTASTPDPQPPIPKRLRGLAFLLVRRIRKRHLNCSYSQLLNHYCHVSAKNGTGPIAHASSEAQVSAFCKVALKRVFPRELWGNDDSQLHNISIINRNIELFIRLQRHETLSLHDVMQQIKLCNIPWLSPNNVNPACHLSKTDLAKRTELMAELIYYVFDSFLIPLIREHFHVTESGMHRNRLFFFRQDIWKRISAPTLESLTATMFEPWDKTSVDNALHDRSLGISTMRLVPKEKGMRPIINLRRQMRKLKSGEVVWGRSINKILTPAFSVLNYERSADPELLASALFSVHDMYARLQDFKGSLARDGKLGQPLYFAKVDVQSCFDTIPQDSLLKLLQDILRLDSYEIVKYSRAKLVHGPNNTMRNAAARVSWKYLTKACTTGNTFEIENQIAQDIVHGRSRTVYVDGGKQRIESRKTVLGILKEHIQSNIIDVNGQLYRQKLGIPQGSIVSSLLCSYSYAQMERDVLSFVTEDSGTILLRLIDDFLVITTQKSIAERFTRVMHSGIPDYGIIVKTEKSRANFDVRANGGEIPKLPAISNFPYCGHTINTVTLDLGKDQERQRGNNYITVEHSKLPGQNFHRKIMATVKIQMSAMLLSTSYNSFNTVVVNIYQAFRQVARKMSYYIRSLSVSKRPRESLVIRVADDAIRLACILIKRQKRVGNEFLSQECCVSDAQARWLASFAFQKVFSPRQTKHRALLEWVRTNLSQPSSNIMKSKLLPMLSRL